MMKRNWICSVVFATFVFCGICVCDACNFPDEIATGMQGDGTVWIDCLQVQWGETSVVYRVVGGINVRLYNNSNTDDVEFPLTFIVDGSSYDLTQTIDSCNSLQIVRTVDVGPSRIAQVGDSVSATVQVTGVVNESSSSSFTIPEAP
jgi:hypothetical protein